MIRTLYNGAVYSERVNDKLLLSVAVNIVATRDSGVVTYERGTDNHMAGFYGCDEAKARALAVACTAWQKINERLMAFDRTPLCGGYFIQPPHLIYDLNLLEWAEKIALEVQMSADSVTTARYSYDNTLLYERRVRDGMKRLAAYAQDMVKQIRALVG